MADQTIFGCPASSYLALVADCSVTAAPACATADPVVYNQACCSSIESFGISLASCYEKSAPACFDTSSALAAASDLSTADYTNPCAQYLGGAGGAAPTAAPSTPASSAAETTAAGTSAGSGSGAASTGSGTAASAGSGTTAAASASAKPNSATSSVGAGLKVYMGVALLGALAVLNL